MPISAASKPCSALAPTTCSRSRPSARIESRRFKRFPQRLQRLLSEDGSAVLQLDGAGGAVQIRSRYAESWLAGQPPLLELRTRRGLRRDEVVDALVERLGLDRAKRQKVKRYYHELEGGLLELKRVDGRVWNVLADTLKARVDDLLSWRPRPVEPAMEAAYRVAELEAAPSIAAPVRALEEPDEIDELFGRA